MGVYGALLGLWATRLLSNRVMDDVDTLRAGLMAVGAGERDAASCSSAATTSSPRSPARSSRWSRASRLPRPSARRPTRARRSLIAAVSHDLRTPVTALRLLADAVDDEIGDPETRREYVRRLGVHVRALGALIDDLFELTRIEAGEVTWTMQQVQIDELVEETVAAMAPAAQRRRHLRARRDRPGARARDAPTPSASSASCSTSSRTRSATRRPTAA